MRAIAGHPTYQPTCFTIACNFAYYGNTLNGTCTYHGSRNTTSRSFARDIHVPQLQIPDRSVVHATEQALESLRIFDGKTLYNMASAVQNTGKTNRIGIVRYRRSDSTWHQTHSTPSGISMSFAK